MQEAMGRVWLLGEGGGAGRSDFFPLFLEAGQLLGKMETVTFY